MISELPKRVAVRREQVLQQLAGAAALLPGARNVTRSADSDFPFRQDSDFFYLTGLDEPDCVALLRPDAKERFVLFVRPRDRDAEVWSGRRTGMEGAREIYGADAAYPITELDQRLPELLQDVDVLVYAVGRDADMDRRVLRLVAEQRRTRPRRGHGIVRLEDPSTLLHEMRLFKDDWELDRMRAAAAITAAAHGRILRAARPGMWEYELQSMLEHEFRRHGASGPAYGTIVGNGANATILHYVENRSMLQDGDLVLVDAGCELDGYAADITRTFPAGAGFTAEQAAIYDLVLAAQRQAMALVRPGARFVEPHERVVDVLSAGLVELGLLAGPPERARDSGDYKKFYMHRTSHWLGLDVHDAGMYERDGEPRRLEPGMVLTVEPGLYLAPDLEDVPPGFRGIGVRIEDDLLVTAAGHEVLTAAAPKERAEIESLRAVAATVS